ncbi:DeoR family transcriptional regulator [Streptomyces griseoincarnatus]
MLRRRGRPRPADGAVDGGRPAPADDHPRRPPRPHRRCPVKKYRTRHDRRDSVRQLAQAEPTLSVRAMARRLQLSKDTVRRDLAALQKEGLLKQPAGTADEGQRAEVARAIASVVPGTPGHIVTVSVVHHHSRPSGAWADSWTGTPEALAERILATVSLTDAQADQIVAAVRTALKGER